MQRSGGHWCVEDLIRWLRMGDATFYAGEEMQGSIWWNKPEGATVGHIAGRFNASDANWMFRRFRAEAKRRGISHIAIEGRSGWARFIRKQREQLDGCQWITE
jgi:hypothetical protein